MQADVIEGTDADDRLEGGTGDDVLIGGRGSDQLVGGSGADTFVIRRRSVGHGVDHIEDFEPAEGDRVELRGFDVKTQKELMDRLVVEHGVLKIRLHVEDRQPIPIVNIGRDKPVKVRVNAKSIVISGSF